MKILEEFLKKELDIIPDNFMKQFILYENLLLEKNKSINLVSRKTLSIEDHILNSVFFLKKYQIETGCRILDLGTGGGFPGIPLKILFPQIRITFLDSIKKKTEALSEIINNMKLQNAGVVCGRAEEISKKKIYMHQYDIVISKAVAPLKELFLWGKDFLNQKGGMICIKGGNIEDELSSLKELKNAPCINVINFRFSDLYNIEDKKLVVLKIQ